MSNGLESRVYPIGVVAGSSPALSAKTGGKTWVNARKKKSIVMAVNIYIRNSALLVRKPIFAKNMGLF